MKPTPGIEHRREQPRVHGQQNRNTKANARGRAVPRGQDRTGHLSEPSANDVQKAGRPVPEPITDRGYGLPKPGVTLPVRSATSNINRIAEPPAR
jgi:hypothetical protein